ncbi:hypothetical protein B296_00050706 [Ensete ventricosum]|uniref:Uncharacterized protein n=1 Tax=Ensete ventricosum TaxID=4639 RepID=A0A426YK70_ENSVE|nr:hypothetical protein B296_00050706 [Ensete ventricosum]
MGACATKPKATEGGSAPVAREETMPDEKIEDVVKETRGGGGEGGETDRRSLGVLMREVEVREAAPPEEQPKEQHAIEQLQISATTVAELAAAENATVLLAEQETATAAAERSTAVVEQLEKVEDDAATPETDDKHTAIVDKEPVVAAAVEPPKGDDDAAVEKPIAAVETEAKLARTSIATAADSEDDPKRGEPNPTASESNALD